MRHSAAFLFFPSICSLAVMFEWGDPAHAQPTGETYDIRPRPIPIVPHGTIVGDRPPEGWSHLVMKSKPCCNRGDVDKVARRDTDLASLFSHVFLAHVVQGSDDPRLWSIRHIAIGIATPIDGKDVVVAPGQSKALGAKLNILERVLLKEIDARLRRITIRVVSPQFAIVDINSAMRFEEKNQQMLLRYALVVEPDSGQLHTFVWLLRITRACLSCPVLSCAVLCFPVLSWPGLSCQSAGTGNPNHRSGIAGCACAC